MKALEVVFLTSREIFHIHKRVVEEFGGDQALRDKGLLESAISMPRATFLGKYLHREIPAMAAAYHFHLCKNHPFLDGNKRVAVVAAETFLLINGWELHATDKAIERITLGLASGKSSKDDAIRFYRAHGRKVEG